MSDEDNVIDLELARFKKMEKEVQASKSRHPSNQRENNKPNPEEDECR